MTRPWPTEPLPNGRPLPSGVRISMFQAARSASLIGWPKPAAGRSGYWEIHGFLAAQPPTTVAIIRASRSSRDRIAHLPVRADRPGEDSIVVLHEPRDGPGLHDVGHRRLNVAGRVHGAALDDGGLAVPVPPIPEAREAFVHHGLLERGRVPVLAAVHRHVHGGNPAAPRPGEPLDLLPARAFQLHAARRPGDDRLALHDEAELPPLALRHRVGVARRLAAEVPGLVADLDAP